MYTRNERIIPISIEEEMKTSYIDYSMSVIVGRALPDVRDGLKPVHRRVLYAMHELGLLHNKPYKKCARVVGEVLGKYHPHGDSSVYGALVRMAQSFAMRYTLVDGQGNFGSIDGDNAAAMRYTESRMERIGEELMNNIEKNTVDFQPNFDGSLEEPKVLPTRIPTLLLNGSSGIAVGMATNIPPHNVVELAETVRLIIENPDVGVKDIMQVLKGPDFPTRGIICGRDPILKMYETGRGHIKLRGKAGIEPGKHNKDQIIITEIPYAVNKSSLLDKMVSLVRSKVITSISDIRDESDKDGMRIVIELKRGENGKVVLNKLYKHTQLQTTFNAIMLVIDNGRPKVMPVKDMILAFIDHRKNVIRRATQFDLDKAQRRAHILEGFKVALANIDEIIKIIKKAGDRQLAEKKLIAKYDLSKEQAEAILNMRLYQLTNLESDKIEKEYLNLIKEIERLQSILASEQKVLNIIKTDMDDMERKYKDERRTEIVADETDINIEDLIADQGCVITVSHRGYIKRTPVSVYRQQKRGGKGVSGVNMISEDYVEHLFTASTHDYILIFTKKGQLHWLKVYLVPEGGRTWKGKALVNILSLPNDDSIAAMIKVRKFDEKYSVFMCSKKGIVKKTNLKEFSNPRKNGIRAINIREDDELISAKFCEEGDSILLLSRNGLSIHFAQDAIREMGRTAAGVIGIRLGKKDHVVASEIVGHDLQGSLLAICENGHGKRTEAKAYRLQGRGGKGIIAIKTTERNGHVVGALKVNDPDEIMVITLLGKMVRMPVKGISVIGRNTQGVKIVGLSKTDKVVAVTQVEEDKEAAVDGENGIDADANDVDAENSSASENNEEDSKE